MKERLLLMPLLPYAVALVCGMLLGTFVGVGNQLIVYLTVFLLCAVAFLLRTKAVMSILPLAVGVFLVGMLLMNNATKDLRKPLPEGRQSLRVVIADTPVMHEGGVTTEFCVAGKTMYNRRVRAFISCDSAMAQQFSVGQTYNIDTRLRLYRNSVSCYLLPKDMHLSEGGAEELPLFSRIGVKARMLRTRLLSAFDGADIGEQERAVLEAMVLGERAHIDSATRAAYSQSGASHLLALSGMHLGILYFLLSWMFVRSGMTYAGRALVLTGLWCYVLLVGMPLSAVRAVIMLTMYDVLLLFGRQRMSINALLFTAMLMLVVNPMCLWDVGFQLSFAAMLGILIFNTPIYNIIGINTLFRHPILRKLWGLMTVSLSAQVLTAPLVVYYFGNVPLLFLFTNIVASVLVTLIIYIAVVGLLCGFVPAIQSVLISVAAFLTGVLNGFLGWVSGYSWTSIKDVHINEVQLLLLYVGIVAITLLILRLNAIRRVYKARRILSGD